MTTIAAIAAVAVSAVGVPMGTAAYEFMERPRAVVLTPAPSGFAVGRAGFAQSAYRANVFRDTEIDRFQVDALVHHAVVDVSRFRLGISYATYMLNGPVNPGDRPGAEAAQWMMNAIQYEYGFVGTWDLPVGGARTALIAEYARRSYHPLRDGFEEPAADVLRGGVAFRDVVPRGAPNVTVDAMARFSWSELYEFWGADKLPDPRNLYTLHLAGEATWRTPLPWVAAFAVVTPDIIYLRDGGWAVDAAFQAGVRLGSGAGRVEVYLDGYHTDDSEQLEDRASPATLLGYGIRFTLSS